MKRPGSLVLAALCLSASSLAGCKPAVEDCEFVELTTTELGALGPTAEDILAEFAAAPPPTLTWLDPPVLEEGWGLAEPLQISHVGTCTTPLHVELTALDGPLAGEVPVGPEGCQGTTSGGRLVPVALSLVSEDGVFAASTETALVLDEAEPTLLGTVVELPASMQLQIGPTTPPNRALVVQLRLVEGQIHGTLHLYSDDCVGDHSAQCRYTATHLLATFGPE